VVWRELLRFTGLALAGLALLLLAGQVAQLRDVLFAARLPWARMPAIGVLVLAEGLLPLAALVGAALAYGRLRSEGVLLARAALAGGPAAGLMPAALVGLALGGAAAMLAQRAVPEAVAALRALVLEGAASAFADAERPVPLPGGGVVIGRPAWAAIPAGEGRVALLHAEAVDARAEDGLRLDLRDARLWSPGLRVRAERATVRLADGGMTRRLGSLGPPNSTPSAGLGDDAHARFVWHRRWAMPALAPLWALLGALLGAALGGLWATLAAAGLVGGGYWVLRSGELAARAGAMSPALAAWLPVMLTALLLALVARPLARRLD
jgi:lipopolysaccharide export LptBFGC system permease protein LptF